MSASAAVPAKGTVLKVGDGGGSEVFTAIGEGLTITGPNYSHTPTDVTNHDSPSFMQEFIAGMRSAGEITIEANYVVGATPQQVGLLADLIAGTKRNFKLVRPAQTTETVSFSAFVKSCTVDHPYNGKLGWKASFQITGLPVVT
jgi:predicted secreted protein